jgi:hypothetical protein
MQMQSISIYGKETGEKAESRCNQPLEKRAYLAFRALTR